LRVLNSGRKREESNRNRQHLVVSDAKKVQPLSPRNTRYQTPEYIAQAIRDKRKKLLQGSYYCPKCGKEKLRIGIDKKNKEVVAVCSCGMEQCLKYVPAFETVDYYNKFIDQSKVKK
jgi:transcription elongation factor Elf1